MIKKIIDFLDRDPVRISASAIVFVTAILTEHFAPELMPLWMSLYVVALVLSGARVFSDSVRGILRRDFLDEKFLMTVASIGAMIVGEFSEGVAVMLFFLIGESFEKRATRHSRASIRALMDICPDEATVLTEDGEERVEADEVEVGSTIIIRPGERVPIDSIVISGSADVDTSSMTGEAVPVGVGAGHTLESGVLVLNGLLTARTLRVSGDSSAQRVLQLVEDASENKSQEERFITKFSRIYTPLVVILALLMAIIPPIFRIITLGESVYRALIFLVISCPCALVISVPMAFFGGIGGAASRGILFKGGNVFSKVATPDLIAFDKTGTITGGSFVIDKVYTSSVSEDELLSLAAAGEYVSNHPIAVSIKQAVTDYPHPLSAEEIPGEGIIAELPDCHVAVGNAQLMARVGAAPKNTEGAAVHIARDGVYIGSISLSDKVKEEAKGALDELCSLGVSRFVMLSGDREKNVRTVCDSVGIREYRAGLTPEEKYNEFLHLMSSVRGSSFYVGDGINDSPTLAVSDVGVAMGGIGQDSAIESADIVIMNDNLMAIADAVRISRKTLAIAKENITFALGAKLLILLLGAFGLANMWLAVFADVGVAVIAILNSMRTLGIRKSNTPKS